MDDLHKYWNHRWLTPKARTQQSSIQGMGVFAIQPMVKGEVITMLGGVIVPRSEIDKYQSKLGHYGIQIDDDFFICPTTKKELTRGTGNHSCEPNLGVDGTNPIRLIAIRDIAPGDELLIDYAFSETHFKPFKCNCGSEQCRRIIKPTDWQLPGIQKRYGKYFSSFLRKKFMKP